MKKSLIKFTALLFVVAFATTSFAADGAKEKKTDRPAGSRGKVTAIADGTLTISNKKKGDTTFKTNAETKYLKADGSEGTASDIKTGTPVMVTPGKSPDQAAKVKVLAPKKKGETTEKPKKEKPATE